MSFSLSTVIMAVLASNLLLFLVYILFKNSKLLVIFGYKTLAFIVFLTVLRLIIPIEFSFTENVFFQGFLAKVYTVILHPYFTLGHINISIWLFLSMIWFIGFVVKIMQYIKLYHKTKATIMLLGHDVTNDTMYCDALEEICSTLKLKNRFRIIEIPNLPCPMIFSFYKPCILFPANHHYDEQTIRFCLQHEIAHYRHGDLHLKFIVELLMMIYWWNPFCKSIQKHLDDVLEVHVDDSVTHRDYTTTKNYLLCLLRIKKDSLSKTTNVLPSQMILAIKNVDESALEKRFQILADFHQSKKGFQHILRKALCTILVVIGLSVYLLSYTIVFESNLAFGGPAPENNIPSFTLTADNAYIIINENGTYDIYLYGCYIETVDSLEYYDESIPIYNHKEDVP